MQRRTITLGHSPDSDDAFMFYPLARGKLETGELDFVHVLQDIETLNRRALRGELDVTACSVHAYAYLHDRYALLGSGASLGDRYGPIVVAREPLAPDALRRARIAIPGTLTSSYLALRLYLGDFEHRVVPFDQIMDEVAAGRAEAGLLIHEGQLTHGQFGLAKVVDLGEWWYQETGLPLPLGANAIRRDLGPELASRVARILRASIAEALAQRTEALDHAQAFARGLDRSLVDRFVGMYVNDLTLDWGERGRQAVQEFLERGYRAGIVPQRVRVDFVT